LRGDLCDTGAHDSCADDQNRFVLEVDIHKCVALLGGIVWKSIKALASRIGLARANNSLCLDFTNLGGYRANLELRQVFLDLRLRVRPVWRWPLNAILNRLIQFGCRHQPLH
jgi:hypothetical protein